MSLAYKPNRIFRYTQRYEVVTYIWTIQTGIYCTHMYELLTQVCNAHTGITQDLKLRSKSQVTILLVTMYFNV